MLILLLFLLVPPLTNAVSRGSGLCIMDLFGGMGVNCGAEDAEFYGLFIEGNVTMECMIGENVTAHLYAQIAANANMRYDFGIVVALDSGTGETGICANFNLEPVSTTNTDLNVTGGSGPFYNGELGEPADLCGDIRSADGINTVDLGVVTFVCIDRNMDGYADVSGGIAWENQVSTGSAMRPHCTGPDDVMLGTRTKCQFTARNIDTMITMPTTTGSTSTMGSPTTTVFTSTMGSPTTTAIPSVRSDISWIVAPILGGAILTLFLLFCCCFPEKCPWFDPRRKRRYSSKMVDLLTGITYDADYIISPSQGTLLHQPPFEVRIDSSGVVRIINIRGNTLNLNPMRNYAFHVCNESSNAFYYPATSQVGIMSGLLVVKGTQTNQGPETKTFGRYKGSIRVNRVL